MSGGRIRLSSQLFAAAGNDDRVAACTVLSAPPGSNSQRLRELIVQAAASEAGKGCGLDVSGFADPAGTHEHINDALLGVHRSLVSEGRRPPAFMITCDAAHERAPAFAEPKTEADFGAWIANLSLRFDGDPETYAALRDDVARAAHRNSKPGVLFAAPAEADNPTPQYRLESTAPCAEVSRPPVNGASSSP